MPPKGFINAIRNFVTVTTVSGITTISEFKPIDFFFSYGAINNTVDGYLYFATLAKGGPPQNRCHNIYKFDKNSHEITQTVVVPKSASITSSYDVHPVPVLMHDADGKIYLVVEKCKNSTNWSDGHDTDILLYRTSTAGDLSTMALWKTLTGFYAYPRLWIRSATNYIMIARGIRASDLHRNITIERSTDTGGTWTDLLLTSTDATHAPYNSKVQSDDNKCWLMVNPRSDTTGCFIGCSLVETEDGITARNAQGTFTRNLSSVGAISQADLVTNCSILQSTNEATEQIFSEGGYIIGGVHKHLISISTKSGIGQDGGISSIYTGLRLYTLSAGSWTYKDVSALLPAAFPFELTFGRLIQYMRTNTTEHIIIIDRGNILRTVVREFISSDGFDTYTERVVMSGTMNLYAGCHAVNFQDGKFNIMYNTIGSYNNPLSYSDMKIVDLT